MNLDRQKYKNVMKITFMEEHAVFANQSTLDRKSIISTMFRRGPTIVSIECALENSSEGL